jgi:hypothetical protein
VAELLDSEDLNHLLSEDLNHLLVEVVMGIGPEGSTLPDTELVRTKREVLKQQVADIKARGRCPALTPSLTPR